jgi:hypothetical protein
MCRSLKESDRDLQALLLLRHPLRRALVAGLAADRFGLAAALWLVAGLTLCSGIGVAVRMRERMPSSLS